MRGLRRRSSFAQLTWPLAALVMILLIGCESIRGPATDGKGWQVLEATGDARFALVGSARWAPLSGGDVLAPASTVSTGPASRVILARGEDRLRLGPSSRLVIPGADGVDPLEQPAGTIEYRLATDTGRVARIRTPYGDAETMDGIFRIEVADHLARTAFEVSEGALRVATADGTRGVTIRRGQRAEASNADGPRLAFARGPGQPLEAVAPLAVPVVAGPVPPAEPLIERAALAKAAPERHPEARSSVTARPPVPSMKADLAGGPDRQEEPGEPDQPVERIILPATFANPRADVLPRRKEDGSPDQTTPAPDELLPLTNGLLEGLDPIPMTRQR